MELPPFEDFLQSVEDNEISVFSGIDLSDIIVMDNVSIENINALIQHLVEISTAFSFKSTFAILRAYHEWLQQQL